MAVDLSIVVVNYNSAGFVEGFLGSLFAAAPHRDGRELDLEVILVDNASAAEDRVRLAALAGPRIRVILNDDNRGYARANNQGFALATGRWHVVANPDVLVLPGALEALVDAVERSDRDAIAGPLATRDPAGCFLMPPNELPTPWLEAVENIARHEPSVARWLARRRSRLVYRYWSATQPMLHDGLSGCFFLGRRATFERYGLFDPDYPLYYEDLDLFRRYAELGLRLWHVPAARIVHFWSRSAETNPALANERNRVGAERYFRKFFGDAGVRTLCAARRRAESKGADHLSPFETRDLGLCVAPPEFRWVSGATSHLELSTNAKFSFVVGVLGVVDRWSPPAEVWAGLPTWPLHARAVDSASGETLGSWRFRRG